MEIKTMEDIMKFHNDLIQKVQKHMEVMSKGTAPTADMVIKEKEGLLEHFKNRLDAITEKEKTTPRYSEEMISYKKVVSRLEKEVLEDKKIIEQATAEAAKKAKE